jgi:N-acetylneuraminate lyase
MPALTGLVAAPFTPFHLNETLAAEIIPQQSALLAKNGVRGAFICGTTGEGSSMTSAERRTVAEAWRACAPKELAVIVQVGCLNLGDSRELAQHAQAIGADAFAAVAPSFFKPANSRDLAAWCAEVAAAAPQLPFYYYHIPSMTGFILPVAEFLAEANGRIPNLAGIKFTYEDLDDYSASAQFAGGKYPIMFGRDENLLRGIELGATAAVGSTYNYAAPLYLRLWKALESGDKAAAQRDQERAREFIGVMASSGGQRAAKAIMKLIGCDCGPVRLPLRAFSAEEEAKLRRDLEAIGFFEYCCKI